LIKNNTLDYRRHLLDIIKQKKRYKMLQKDVVIIGAGPGGSTAALQLNKMGISCMLIDKSVFPRDKTCGDALSGKVKTIFNRIDPEIMKRFVERGFSQDVYGMRLFAPNRVCLDLPFRWNYDAETDEAPGFVVPRTDMDHFLVEEVKRCKLVDFMEGVKICEIKKNQNGFHLLDSTGSFEVQTKLLLLASGANGNLVQQLTGVEKRSKRHYAGAVRAYFENVSGLHPDGLIELHFLDEYLPGYFWIFPLKGNRANVGMGLRSDFISKRQISLKKTLDHILKYYPGIRERFMHAKQLDKPRGYPLPLGSGKLKRSGERFILLGDAAHLVDPLTGEGFGNAVYSGWVAAEQAARCFEKGRFDEKEMRNYDKRIERVMGVELKLSYQLQRIMRNKALVNMFSKRISKSEKLKKLFTRMYSDLELRKQLANPMFILKILTGNKK
jgi:geranylgeranyl reductase family protein